MVTWNSLLVILECLLFSTLASKLYTINDITDREDYEPERLKLENTAFGTDTHPTPNTSKFLHTPLRNDPEMSFDNTDINYHTADQDPLESFRLIDHTPATSQSPAPSVVVTIA
eukprot:sb/3476904/